MVVFSRIVTLGSLAAGALAAPWPINSKHATHRVRAVVEGREIHAFQPASSFETFGVEGIPHPLSKRAAPATTREISEKFIESHLGIASSDFAFKSGFDGEITKHAFFRQQFHGIPVANAVANVAINKDDQISSFSNNFVKPTKIASPIPAISTEEAITKAENALEATHNDHPPTLEFFAKDDGSMVLTHVVQVENDDHWFEAFVDAANGEIVAANDFTAHASFRVVPLTNQDPTTGFSLLANPEDRTASPNGWVTSTATDGNNVVSFKGAQTATAAQTASGVFDYTFSSTSAPTVAANVALAKVNAFYVANSVHDITYRYGFTEAAFNFQTNNFGKGGAQNDRVTISVQDSAGTNNADFSTPPDGQSGRMRMFLWTHTTPQRDGALENDIVSHEATHGTSNRLTGGGTGRCLQTTEAGGMGEGWSDAFAEWTEQTSAPLRDFTLGSYVIGSAAGIRTHPYSTSSTVNPLTYASVATLNEVHNIGEVWANMLHNVHAALVTAHGFSATAKTDPTQTGGNAVFLHLFIDQLALQPCNPTFLTARNAWIQADANRFAGANKCILWRAFASKGLGVNAANHVNDATVPAGC